MEGGKEQALSRTWASGVFAVLRAEVYTFSLDALGLRENFFVLSLSHNDKSRIKTSS